MPDDEDTFCARRGSQWLSEEELEAHLATVLRLENVGVFLGAGASAGTLGGKTATELWSDFEDSSPSTAAWLQEERFSPDGEEPNVESILDALEIARLEARRTGREHEELEGALGALKRAVIRAAILQESWWSSPGEVSLDTTQLDQHRRLLLKLTSSRMPGQPAPWVFTTNYDLAIEWAAETISLNVTNGFGGLHHRTFSSHNFDLGYRNVLARGEARFGTYNIYLAKLHGSLSWYVDDSEGLREGSCGELWKRFNDFLEGVVEEAPGLVVYPSGSKHLDTASFELGELVRRFSEFVARPQSGLIVSGYSLSDHHLNRILLSSLQNPTFHLVIYFPESNRQNDDLTISNANRWMRRLAHLESPQVTIVGGGEEAYFDRLVTHIPDPVVYDEQAAEIRQLLQELRQGSASPPDEGRASSLSADEDDEEDILF